MKKIHWIILYIILASSLSSCKDSGSPESITELFIISYKNMDFVTMKNISTRNTKDLLKVFEFYTQDSVLAQEWQDKYDKIKIKITDKIMENDTTAYVKFETQPDIFPVNEIRLVQVTEKLDKKSWKIDISTIDMLTRKNMLNTDTLGERVSHDGQVHPDADSVATKE